MASAGRYGASTHRRSKEPVKLHGKLYYTDITISINAIPKKNNVQGQELKFRKQQDLDEQNQHNHFELFPK